MTAYNEIKSLKKKLRAHVFNVECDWLTQYFSSGSYLSFHENCSLFFYVRVSLSSCVFYYVFGYKMTTYNEIKSLKKKLRAHVFNVECDWLTQYFSSGSYLSFYENCPLFSLCTCFSK